MREVFKRKSVVVLSVAWLVAIAAIGASSLTLLLVNGQSGTRFVSEAEAGALERYARLNEVYTYLMDGYYQELDGDALVQGAIDGMMSAVNDPYTFYYTPEEMAAQRDESEGVYHGIGVVVTMAEDGLAVRTVYEGSPAACAGILAGDVILTIDGEPVDTTASLADASVRIKGADDTLVRFTLRRGAETLAVESLRGSVSVSYVRARVLADGIGYIRVDQFTGDAVTGMKRAMEELRDADVRGVVVDLRNDPGGLLNDVVEIADLWLDQRLIVYVQDRTGSRTDYYSDEACWDVPMAVLVNRGSASASEIFAAAVKENGRGAVVGETTYGKGIVQSVVTFSKDGAGMQYTTASYYTPLGNSIHGVGVMPDVEVSLAEGVLIDFDEPDPEIDAQLAAAMNTLK